MKFYIQWRKKDSRRRDEMVLAVINHLMTEQYDVEHLYILDADNGRIIDHIIGDLNSVQFSEYAYLYNTHHNIITVHNHPYNDSIPSVQDLVGHITSNEVEGYIVGQNCVTMIKPNLDYIRKGSYKVDDWAQCLKENFEQIEYMWKEGIGYAADFEFYTDWMHYCWQEMFRRHPFMTYTVLYRDERPK